MEVPFTKMFFLHGECLMIRPEPFTVAKVLPSVPSANIPAFFIPRWTGTQAA